MKKYLLDTNVFLRLILKDNPEQLAEMQILFEQAESGEVVLFCPGFVFFEIYFVLTGQVYNSAKEEVVKILQTLLKISVIEFENKDIWGKSLEVFVGENISLPDAYFIAQSLVNDFEFYSFDKRAGQVYKKMV